ncbi:hypothetical protein LX32DRAFT_407204 [Colletotrichum zoysiae]|uniref:Uncharacterized protein n=1 Tax=Colletotrichum zoysiae TaxID=1216348 RepID=A0AAD9HHC6_9PEZI|nr:hypothetical protein LX32DRAFT_407204 [Colletotrichum zoysiae]
MGTWGEPIYPRNWPIFFPGRTPAAPTHSLTHHSIPTGAAIHSFIHERERRRPGPHVKQPRRPSLTPTRPCPCPRPTPTAVSSLPATSQLAPNSGLVLSGCRRGCNLDGRVRTSGTASSAAPPTRQTCSLPPLRLFRLEIASTSSLARPVTVCGFFPHPHRF